MTEWLYLLVFAGGLLAGGGALALINRRRVEDAVLKRTRELEAANQQAVNDWALERSRLEHEQRSAESQAARLREELTQAQGEYRALQGQHSDSRQEVATYKTRLEEQGQRFQEQLATLRDARAELTKDFENVANKIFEHKQQQFSQSSKSLLETTLDPLKTQLTDFRRKVEEVYEKENAERNRLSGQVQELQKQAQKIGEDAVNLAQALKGNTKSQGNWGEVVLERLLEQSGLQKGREYDTQVSLSDEAGRRRMPDVIVRLPEEKDIIIDAKVSLVDYEKFCSSDDAAEREQYLNQHVQSMRAHIKGLNIKGYEKLEGVRTLDFVFIFVPIEAAFMLALQHDPELYREAYDRHIILASPTTLLAILRTVENIWRYEKQNRNAEKIARTAGGLHDQFVLVLESLETVGTQIDKARDAYDLAHKRLRTGKGNVFKRVDDLRKLGAKTKKSLGRERLDVADDIDDEVLLIDGQDDDDGEGSSA